MQIIILYMGLYHAYHPNLPEVISESMFKIWLLKGELQM